MESRSKERQQKSYTLMRRIYDFAMAMLILGLAMVLLFGERWNIQRIINLDPILRYMFAGISILYGGFRIYRGIKAEY
jgi:hypothetical protein